MLLQQEREAIVEYGKRLVTHGLTRGTGGNISLFDRASGHVAISPSGLDYFQTEAADVPVVDLGGNAVDGRRAPSSEMPFHLILYNHRPEINAVVHTHSMHATALACMGLEIPPVHYLIGFAGKNIRCAKYATFGTRELAENALAAMADRKAALLASHGVIAGGADIQEAFMIAETVEFCAEIYCRCRSLGTPLLIPETEMEVIMEKFKQYGKR